MNQAELYPAIPHEFVVVLVYTFLAITGLCGNIWVIKQVISQLFGCRFGRYVGNRHRGAVSGVQHSACIYLLLLSVVDLISFVPVPLLAADIVANRWPFGIWLCKLLWSCEGANKSLSPLVLTALSVDRYIAVCRPSFLWLRQTSFALLVIAVCIFISSLFIVPVTFKANIGIMEDSNKEEHLKCILGMSRTYDVLHILICYVLPLTLICSVYVAILRRLYQHTRRSSTVGRRTSISLSRVVKCSVLVVAFYFICWTPYIWMFRIGAIFSGVTDSLPPSNQIHDDYLTPASPSNNKTSNPGLFFLSENLTSIYYKIMAITNNSSHPPISHKNLSSSDFSLLSMLLASTKQKGEVIWEDSLSFLDTGNLEDQKPPDIMLMYLLHALPYTQSAFNWLFYAFLNRNLRQSRKCPGTSTRSMQVTSTPVEGNGHTSTNTNGANGAAPLWKNLQCMGSYLKSASIDTGQSMIRRSPFRSRSRIRSRSTTCLETSSSYNQNGCATIISLLHPSSTSKANGLLTAPPNNLLNTDHNHILTSFSLLDINGEEVTGFSSIRRAAHPNNLGRPSLPNSFISQNHCNGGVAADKQAPIVSLLSPGEVDHNQSQPSSSSSFASLGLSFEPIAEGDYQDEVSLNVPLTTDAVKNSKDTVVNGIGLTLLDLEGTKPTACSPDNKSEAENSEVEWL